MAIDSSHNDSANTYSEKEDIKLNEFDTPLDEAQARYLRRMRAMEQGGVVQVVDKNSEEGKHLAEVRKKLSDESKKPQFTLPSNDGDGAIEVIQIEAPAEQKSLSSNPLRKPHVV